MVRYSFPNKVVLVTGGSRGMGAAILEAFAAAGAVCVVNYFNDPNGQNHRDAEETAGRLRALNAPAVHIIEADVSQYESVEHLMKRDGGRGGRPGYSRQQRGRDPRPDDQENDAGRLARGAANQPGRRLLLLEARRRADARRRPDRQHRVDLRPGRLPRPGQLRGGQGRRDRADQGAAKELARRRITVNAVAPGVIRTPMLAGLKPEVLAEYEKQIPVGRVGRPADVAHAVLFFACEESAYITGQTLPITGGWL